MSEPVDEWRTDWANLKTLTRLSWVLFLGWLPLCLAFGSIFISLHAPEALMLLFVIPYVAGMIFVYFLTRRYRCPRCGDAFFIKSVWGLFTRVIFFATRCQSCGLGKYTPSYSAKPFNKITDN